MRNKAWRRSQKNRYTEKAKDFLTSPHVNLACRNITDRTIGKRSTTRVSCSCYMCGNPRKFSGERTIQEKKQSYDNKGE